MKHPFESRSRRWFLSGGSFATLIAAGVHPRYIRAAQLAAQHGEIYRELGVRPFINAAGTYTVLTGSLLPERARRAMQDASRYFVHLNDLQKAAGERIAKLLGVEAAMVTSGAACAIMLATAACVTGTDTEKIRRIPDLQGMKSDVIIPRGHRNGFDHAARSVGIKLVEVGTLDELHGAIGPQTAMLYFTNIFEYKGAIKRQEFIAAGRRAGIPVFNDADGQRHAGSQAAESWGAAVSCPEPLAVFPISKRWPSAGELAAAINRRVRCPAPPSRLAAKVIWRASSEYRVDSV